MLHLKNAQTMKIQSVPWAGMGNCTVLAERPSTYRDTEITTLIPDGQIIGKHNTSGPLYKFYFSITLHFAEKKNM